MTRHSPGAPRRGLTDVLAARLSPAQALVALVVLSALAGALITAIAAGYHWAALLTVAIVGRGLGALLGHLVRMLPPPQ